MFREHTFGEEFIYHITCHNKGMTAGVSKHFSFWPYLGPEMMILCDDSFQGGCNHQRDSVRVDVKVKCATDECHWNKLNCHQFQKVAFLLNVFKGNSEGL